MQAIMRGVGESSLTAGWLGFAPLLPISVLAGSCRDRLPPWCVMWLLAVAIFGASKWLTWRLYVTQRGRPRIERTFGYLFAWPGMDAAAFLDIRRLVAPPQIKDWLAATFKTLLGCVLLWGVTPRWMPSSPFFAGWVGMIGLVTTLHFGVFHLLALTWQHAGVAVEPIMDRPLLATSLADFWGRRWNRAFRELANTLIYRPLTKTVGPRAAFAITFGCSGVIHDVVITVPSRAGYGRPTAYFLLQAAAIFFARSSFGRRFGLDRGHGARLFAGVVLVGPLGLLFPRSFVETVMSPFLRTISGGN